MITVSTNIMATQPLIQVLSVDDHDIVRLGLTTLLASYDDMEMIGEASNGQEAVNFCDTVQPNIILMDINMPIMDGIRATQLICQKYPLICVIIFTGSNGLAQIAEAVQAGAKGYIRKNVPLSEIILLIRTASKSNN